MSDLYNDVMLRRWSLDLSSGQKECLEDAVDVTLISGEDRAAIEAKNADIHAAIEAVETYEAALRVAEPEEPHTQDVLDDEGNVVGQELTPAYEAWTAAQTTIGMAEAGLLALARLRAGEASEEDLALVETTWGYPVEIHVGPQGDAVNAERERRIVAGASVAVPGIGAIPVQGRDEDIRNLQGLGMAALARMTQGDVTTVTPFRDAENVTHELTPPQMFALWQGSATYVSAVYQASWDIKTMAPIPEAFADDGYWPAG